MSIQTLKTKGEFNDVFRRSIRKKLENIPIVLYLQYSPEIKYGFIIPKKVGNAVYRNKIRRRIKYFFSRDYKNNLGKIIIKLLPHKETILTYKKIQLMIPKLLHPQT